MRSHRLTDENRRQLVEFAENYGKSLADQAYPQGPGLDVNLAGLEEIAIELQQALLRGFCETTTRAQTQQLAETLPCPDCGAECEVQRPETQAPPDGQQPGRRMQTRGGPFELVEPRCYCRSCRRSFFPSADGSADRRARLQSGGAR